jgi:hypothetical protein
MAAVSNHPIVMLTLTAIPLNGAFSVRPVCKATDRTIIRELFRKEFYGDLPQTYPDEGLWEIYDSMEPSEDEVFGAYMVYYRDHLLFLMEIHPPVMMGLAPELSQPRTVGVYCFFNSLLDSMNPQALRACIGSLLDHPSVDRILTTLTYTIPADPRIHFLERSGFKRVLKSPDRAAVYSCTAKTFPILAETGSVSTYFPPMVQNC